MNLPEDRISTTQVVVLLTSTVVGVTFISMPQVLGETAGRDGWISLALGGLVVLGVNTTLVFLGWRFPGMTIIQYSRAVLGPLLGRVVNWILILFFILSTALVTREFGDVTKIYLLNRTPLEVLLITNLVVTAYLVYFGLNALARLDQVFFPLIMGSILMMILLAQKDADYSELLPVLQQGIGPVLHGTVKSFNVYSGYGLMAFLLPFMRHPREALWTSTVGLTIPVFGFMVVFIVTVAVLGGGNQQFFLFPVASLAQVLEVPGAFIERVDTLILSLWIIAAYTTVAALYYISVLAAGMELGLKAHQPLVLLWLPLIYFLALLPQNFGDWILADTALGYASLGLGVIPPLLLGIAAISGKRGGRDASGA